MKTIIRNTQIINDQRIVRGDLLIKGERIEKVAPLIRLPHREAFNEINGESLYLIPGLIDAHVHFREPGLTRKGDMASESAAAAAGGVTSIVDMPNTNPATLTLDLLEDKFRMASRKCLTNYSFYMGVCKENLDEALRIDPAVTCGISDDGLYFGKDAPGTLANDPETLEWLCSRSSALIALHAENEQIIKDNLAHEKEFWKDRIPMTSHRVIRSAFSCLEATKLIIDIASRYGARIHILHISTGAEVKLFNNTQPTREKNITTETCPHYLIFDSNNYEILNNKIKWNPSIKRPADREALVEALTSGNIDTIGSDHAPHQPREKVGNYENVLSGGPMVQHTLQALLQLYHENKISLETIVQKTSHGVANCFSVKERGFIREGYYADLALLDPESQQVVGPQNIKSKCGWSPFNRRSFRGKVMKTFVNGNIVFDNGVLNVGQTGKRLQFSRSNK